MYAQAPTGCGPMTENNVHVLAPQVLAPEGSQVLKQRDGMAVPVGRQLEPCLHLAVPVQMLPSTTLPAGRQKLPDEVQSHIFALSMQSSSTGLQTFDVLHMR